MVGRSAAYRYERTKAAIAERQKFRRRDDIAHCARQEGRRYRLHRRAIDSAPFSSLATGRASRSWSALRTAELSEIARVVGAHIIFQVQPLSRSNSLSMQ